MTYATLMVQLELGQSNANLLRVTADLAERFHASVIGIAGSQTMSSVYSDGLATGEIIVEARDEARLEIEEAEAAFRGALRAAPGTIEWRSTTMSLSLCEYIAGEARSADLLLTSAKSGDLLAASYQMNVGELLLQLGRPVLNVPGTATKLALDRIVVAWKDSREARRAALDALPLLKKAAHVAVVEVATGQDVAAAQARVNDVGAWLKRHGVVSECTGLYPTGDETAQLKAIAHKQGADLIVAGAYGHSRLREFVFGGVTRDLLRSTEGCLFMSH